MNNSSWRLEGVNGGNEQYPVESCFAVRHSPPDEQDPRFDRSAPTQVRFVRFAVRHTPSDQQDPRFDRRRSISSVLRYATPSQSTGPRSEHRRSVSSAVRYTRPRFHRMFRPSPLDQHDHAFHSDPAGWLPMNTTTTLFLRSNPAMYTSPRRTYARVGARDPARMYVRGRIFFLAHWPLYVRVHATCAPLLRHVRATTSMTCARLYMDQYVCTRSRPE